MQTNVCKSCGGDLERIGNYYVCRFCGNKWMIDADNDVHVIDRANAWSALRDCDFERAVELFENIIFKEPENHEAYWGMALADAGIMYVTDLDESKKVPTCNSISEVSFIDSKYVQKAIELAPADISESYKKQAEQIEEIRVEWLRKASKEKPYDIFICYKDSDREHNIDRTDDSYDAHELYNALTAEGYRVFFSRVSLRDKISEHYEPYIFNALKTAKVMIVFGEKPEYFKAVWVKNEWTRFRTRIKLGEKHPNSLVAVYKNMAPTDLPVGLRSIQCLNADEMTFLENLKSHVSKIINSSPETEIKPIQKPKVTTEIKAEPRKTKVNKRRINRSLAIIAVSLIFVVFVSLLAIFGISQLNNERERETTLPYEQTSESLTESEPITESTAEITTAPESVFPENSIGDPGEYSYDSRQETVYVYVGYGVSISLRSESYDRLGTLEYGTEIIRTGISTDPSHYWSRIEYEGEIYYVASKFLTYFNPLDADNGFIETNKTVKINFLTGSLNIRELPSVDSNVIGYVTFGEDISVIAVNEEMGWYKIEFIDTSGEFAIGYIVSNEIYYE